MAMNGGQMLNEAIEVVESAKVARNKNIKSEIVCKKPKKSQQLPAFLQGI